MKILRIYLRVAPVEGGMESHITELTRLQNNANIKVTLAFGFGDKVSGRDMKIKVPSFLSYFPQVFSILYLHLILSFRLMLNGNKYDFLHVHGDWSSLLLVSFIKRVIKARRCLFSIHGHLENHVVKNYIFKLLLNQIDLIHSTGYQAINHVRSIGYKGEYLLRPSGIDQNFIDTSRIRCFKPEEESLHVVVVAIMRQDKNIAQVVEIAQKIKDVKFVIIGDGEQFDAIRAQVGNTRNILLTGRQDKIAIQRYMDRAHIILSTSLREGTPTSLLEGISNGLAFVSSNAGGINHTLRKYSGFIIEDGATHSYVKAIENYLRNPELLRSHSSNNMTVGAENSWINVARYISNFILKK